MKEYITDSIYFKKRNKDFLFYANEIYTWKIEEATDGLEYVRTGDFTEADELTGLVSSSNYRLLHDILLIDSNVSLYEPEYNKEGFLKKYKVNKKEVFKEFDNYMKRSYISYLSYNALKNIGLKRIEPFIIMLASIPFSSKKIYDNLFISKIQFTIKKIKKDSKVYKRKDKKVDLIKFIYASSKKLDYEFIDIFSSILKLYSELKCSDPFSKEGIEFFKDDNELYFIYKEISKKEIEYNKILIEDGKKKILVNKAISKYSDEIMNYYLLQGEDYFEGKVLLSDIDAPSLIELIPYLNKIIPIKDILLSIQLLERMNKVKIFDLNLSIPSSLKSRLNISHNKEWVDLKTWKEIYENIDYIFNEIIEPIDIDKISFECPVCGNNVYSITPQKLFCSRKDCDFVFHRSNLKTLGVSKVSLENIIEGLENKSILIDKDKSKGNIPVFLNRKDNFYSFWIK